MKSLLVPRTPTPDRFSGTGVIVLLALSALAILLAPFVVFPTYSWKSNVISQSAGQGIDGAWVARTGFLLFGFAVLRLATSLRSVWARGTYLCHMAFGVFMVSAAAFSERPWLPYIPFDTFEDFLHSVTATGMGFAFTLGVLTRFVQRGRAGESGRRLDIIALGAAVALPLLGWLWPSYAGLAQRVMFLIAYLWYGNEALVLRRGAGRNRSDAVRTRFPRGYI